MREQEYQFNLRRRYFRFAIELKYLERLLEYAEKDRQARMRPLIDALQKDPSIDYAAMIQQLGTDYLDEYTHAELFAKYMMVHSVFVSMFTAFEFQLASVASVMYNLSHQQGAFEDVAKGKSYIDRARKYLQQRHKVLAASPSQPVWQKINLFRKVRNGVTHLHNRLKPSDEKECKPFLESYDTGFDEDTGQFFIPNEQFVKDFATAANNFLHAIIKEIAPVPPFVPKPSQ